MEKTPGGVSIVGVRAGSIGFGVAIGLALVASAQREPVRDLSWMALQWARGDFRAPLVCEIDEVPHRGLRRVLITPGPRDLLPPVDRVRLFDLEVPEGTRCVTEVRGEAPNVMGTLAIAHRATSRTDTAEHDFEVALRRQGGFEYEIVNGRLRIGPTDDKGALREVDFVGGRAQLKRIDRGSDAQRRLAEFAGRKLHLTLEAPSGTRVEFDLVQFEIR